MYTQVLYNARIRSVKMVHKAGIVLQINTGVLGAVQ